MEKPQALHTRDAVVVIPGILGSELVDTTTDEVVWGLHPRALGAALITGSAFDQLQRSTLRATRLLQVPSYLPGLGRFEPYSGLVNVLSRLVVDRAALGVFPYDWRRPIAETSLDLATLANTLLGQWRSHAKGSRHAQLVLVGHSMGGLLARHAANCHLPPSDVAMILTLGTPFGGSVRAVRAIGHGDLLPIGHLAKRLRRTARQMPSLHDLLPTYPALVRDGKTARPTTADLAACGADRDLLALTETARQRLERAITERPEAPLFALTGTAQPTIQSFSITHGRLDFFESVDGTDWGGDGTVYFGAGYPIASIPFPLPQQHGALAKTDEAIEWIRHTIAAVTLGPPQGTGVGISAPDAVLAGHLFEVRVEPHGVGGVSCRIDSAGGGTTPGPLTLTRRDSGLIGSVRINQPGIYTASARGGGFAAVSVDILVVPDELSMPIPA